VSNKNIKLAQEVLNNNMQNPPNLIEIDEKLNLAIEEIDRLRGELEASNLVRENTYKELLQAEHEAQEAKAIVRAINESHPTILNITLTRLGYANKFWSDAIHVTSVFQERDQLREKLAVAVEALEKFSNARRRTVFDILPDTHDSPKGVLMLEIDSEIADKALAKIRGEK
jgi:hypothetical protein